MVRALQRYVAVTAEARATLPASEKDALFISAKALKKPGVAQRAFRPLTSDAIASGIREVLIKMDMPGWVESAWGTHYIRGFVASTLRASGFPLDVILNRLRLSAPVFAKHYSRLPMLTVQVRLNSRKRPRWSLSEAPFV